MNDIHKNANVFVTHDHSMYKLVELREQGEQTVFSHHLAPLIRQGGVKVIGWVVGGDGADREHPWWGTLKWLDMLWMEAEESQDTLAVCLNYQDIENAVAAGKVAIVLSIEGSLALQEGPYPNSLVNLRSLYRLGVRSLQLVGSGWNQITDVLDGEADTSNGLTSFGKDVIREMNRLGMVIDLAHIPDPDPVFEDIVEISQAPVLDSHRGVRGATDIQRNMSDERIRAIANTGGVIGLHFFSVVLTSEAGRRANVEDLIRHIDHIVEAAGIDHVSLGPDFLDSKMITRKPDHYAEGIDEITKLPRVTEALVKHGYSENDIRKILGENILRVYKEVIG